MTKKNNNHRNSTHSTRRNTRYARMMKERLIAITILLGISITLTLVATSTTRYALHSIDCNFAETSGNTPYYTAGGQRNWSDADYKWYNDAWTQKNAFIESNFIAKILNFLGSNPLFKLIQLAIVFSAPFACIYSWYILFQCIKATYITSSNHNAKRRRQAAIRNNPDIIDFNQRRIEKERQRRSLTQAGYYPKKASGK